MCIWEERLLIEWKHRENLEGVFFHWEWEPWEDLAALEECDNPEESLDNPYNLDEDDYDY